MPKPNTFADPRHRDALSRLNADPQPVHLEISKLDAFFLIAQVQLACRHPGNNGPTRARIECIMRDLGKALAIHDADLRNLIELGWRPDADRPAGPETKPSSNSFGA